MSAKSHSQCAAAIAAASSICDKLTTIDTLLDSILIVSTRQQSELLLTRLKNAVDEFQENPQLMDTQLDSFFTKLLSAIPLPSPANAINSVSSSDFANSTTATITNDSVRCDLVHNIFASAYLLTKVRGFKSILRHFPHSVDYVLPILELTEIQDVSSSNNWQTKYMLLLWLSILVQVPFDMTKFEGNSALPATAAINGTPTSSLTATATTTATSTANASVSHGSTSCTMTMTNASPATICNVNSYSNMNTSSVNVKHTISSINERILNVIKSHILQTGKSSDAAAYLAARFLSRPDVDKVLLGHFINWSMEDECRMRNISILMSLQYLYKIGKRQLMQPYSTILLAKLDSLDIFTTCNDQLVIKYCIKLVQQIGLSFLKVKLATWRYKKQTTRFLSTAIEAMKSSIVSNCSSNGLSDSLNGSLYESTTSAAIGNNSTNDCSMSDMDIDSELDYDIPNELEDVIEILLNGLRQGSTVVRWSAAKGIGRITSRLSKDLAEPILDSILELFSLRESDSAWHGGCLTLAELGRRGLILPSHMSQVMTVVKDALVYDEFKGCYSVGSHVRNAACYVCWSFARAYDAFIIKPYVADLASHLLIVALYDREVNVRQAASAAIQEHVGRQGALPEGIEIITLVDYTSVSSRKICYTQLAPAIAKFTIYQEPLIDHLVNYKIGHWDSEIRTLASHSLYALAKVVPSNLIKSIAVGKLITMSTKSNINERNGSLLAMGSVIRALNEMSIEIPSNLVNHVKTLLNGQDFTKYLAGFGSENTRSSLCHLINCVCISPIFPLDPWQNSSDAQIINEWQSLLLETLFTKSDLRLDGVNTLPQLTLRFVVPSTDSLNKLFNLLLVEKLNSANDERILSSIFQYFTLLPFDIVSLEHQRILIDKLISITSSIRQVDLFMPLARASAIKCLAKVILQISPDEITFGCKSVNNLHINLYGLYTNCLINCCNDYTCSSEKGDISLVVREGALNAIKDITVEIMKRTTIPSELLDDLICTVLTLAVSHQSSTRVIAFDVLKLILPLNGLSLDKIISGVTVDGQGVNGDCVKSSKLNGSNNLPNRQHKSMDEGEDDYDQVLNDPNDWVLPVVEYFLPHNSYGKYIWIGIIPSVGCKTISVSNWFQSMLSKCLKFYSALDGKSTNERLQLTNGKVKDDAISNCNCYLTSILAYFGEVFELYSSIPRMSEALLNTLNFLLNHSFIDDLPEPSEFCKNLLKIVWSMISKSSEPSKKITAAHVISAMMRFQQCTRASLNYLMALLCSPKFPRVRIATAEILNIAVVTWADNIFEPEIILNSLVAVKGDCQLENANENSNQLLKDNLISTKSDAAVNNGKVFIAHEGNVNTNGFNGHTNGQATNDNNYDEDGQANGDLLNSYEEKTEIILNILSETDWGQPVNELKPIRNQLCLLLGLKPYPN